MVVLQHLAFPTNPRYASLYSAGPADVFVSTGGERRLVVPADARVSLCSYFNCFFPRHFCDRAGMTDFVWRFVVAGAGEVRVVRRDAAGKLEVVARASTAGATTVSLPFQQSALDSSAILFPEFEAGSAAPLQVTSGELSGAASPKPIRLGIISCTFRKEDFIRRTAAALCSSGVLADVMRMFVVDNAGTLSPHDFPEAVTLLRNPNFGGAGGFARGMLEAAGDGTLTHLLLMDDDIDLEPEVVFRTIALFSVLPSGTAISGGMLDMERPAILFEAGGDYLPKQLAFASARSNLDMGRSEHLAAVQSAPSFQYGAFWYFAFEARLVAELGLPLPFFIRGDDAEYGIRLTAAGVRILHHPGISVWHEPFYGKRLAWSYYYTARNALILNAVHFHPPRLLVLVSILKLVGRAALLMNYRMAEALLDGVAAYLAGPREFQQMQPDALHETLARLEKEDADRRFGSAEERAQHFGKSPGVARATPLVAFLRLPLAAFSLNGHLLPNFLLSSRTFPVDRSPGAPGASLARVGLHRRLVLLHSATGSPEFRQINRRRFLGVLGRSLRMAVRFLGSYARVRSGWSGEAHRLGSPEFWREYLSRSDPN